MKKSVMMLLFLLVACAQQAEYCVKQDSGEKLSFSQAWDIAMKSDCVKDGSLKTSHFCNEITGTWWVDLDIKKEGCSPACVINVATKQAEINWRCTGLLQS